MTAPATTRTIEAMHPFVAHVGRRLSTRGEDKRPEVVRWARLSHLPTCRRLDEADVEVLGDRPLDEVDAWAACTVCLPDHGITPDSSPTYTGSDAEPTVRTQPVGIDGRTERDHYEVQPAAPVPPTVPGVQVLAKSNRYAGSCVVCGTHVAEAAGFLAKRNGGWVVVHPEGECTERQAPVAAPRVERPVTADVPEGHYAIASSGSNDLAFYRVDRPTEGKWAGRCFVKLVVGGHPDSRVRRDAVQGVLARIVEAGVVESGRLYGREIGRCCRCNRTLTDEVSRAEGIGPECRKHEQ